MNHFHRIKDHLYDLVAGTSSQFNQLQKGVIDGTTGLVLSISICVICWFRRKSFTHWAAAFHKKESVDDQNIEEFIRTYRAQVPKRYWYSDVKKITNSFKVKLGQGGHGSVYKGKLPDGRLIVVKILSESRGNGVDFINEVASIGRTSHINIVSLLGYCYERKTRALIYEFMPNGSLDRFINGETKCQLEWETLYKIATGIARGLDCLHRGCSTRILHYGEK